MIGIVPYSPQTSLQFYLVFALASMYIAMLMTGWGSQAGEAKVGPGGRLAAGPAAVPVLACCIGWASG